MSTLADLLGLRRPVIQAPIGGCAGPELVAAVAEAGGLGLLACTWATPNDIAATIAAARTLSAGAIGGNLVLRFPIDQQLDALLEAGVPIVTFSWGRPGVARVRKCHAAGARVAVQVGTTSAVAALLDDGVDALIVQGSEAGGHVQSTTPLHQLLPAVLEQALGVPVIAAGGIATRQDVTGVLAAGAQAAMLGTRFVATRESRAHARYKDLLVAARGLDAVMTLAFDGDWPFGPHRVLRSSTLDRWEAAGCPWPGERPGEGEAVLTRPDGRAVQRYSDAPPLAGDAGDVDAACLYAGSGVGEIDDVPSAGELMARLSP